MAKGTDFKNTPGGPSTGSGSGWDFKKNPGGPATGGMPAKPTMPKREMYPAPANGIPVPEGGRMPFKAPVYAQEGLGANAMPTTTTSGASAGGVPYKNLKG